MQHIFYSRLFPFIVAFAWGFALAAQPRVEAPPATATTAGAPLVSLRLAGIPRPGAAAGQRIFFTVQEDVFYHDSLLIAAGARAKGCIREIRYSDTILYLTVTPEAVQTVEGEMAGLAPESVSMEVDLGRKEAGYVQCALLPAASIKTAAMAGAADNVFRVP